MNFVIVLSCFLFAANAAPNGDSRIVNGENAAEGQFPYEVSLRYLGGHSCGASILDEFTILSAAHCVHERDHKKMTILLGNNNLWQQTDLHEVVSYTIHENYNITNFPNEVSNDIAILKLKTPIEFRKGVRPVKLRQTNIGIEDVIISGWGATSYPGTAPEYLQFAKMTTLTRDDCQKEHKWPVFDTSLCAFSKPGQGACHGDSGSPLVDLNYEQVGIASWVEPCGVGKPDIYARVYSFLDWIEANRH